MTVGRPYGEPRGRVPCTVAALLLVAASLFGLGACTENQCDNNSVCGDKNSATEPAAPPSAATAGTGAIHATATIGGQESATDFYWPRSPDVLSGSLAAGHALASEPGMTEVADTITLTLQTDSPEAVLMKPVRVVDLHRRADPRAGLLARLPCGGCGGQSDVRLFSTRLDDPAPVVVPRQAGSAGRYYYITAGSPEEFEIAVADQHCDCTFDLELDWLAQGVAQSVVLDDGGRHFRALGSDDLPWYRDYNPGGAASVLVPQAAPTDSTS
ncbi:hypothetical protein ABH931_004661 [Streptacidiphilus sp. MAP12-33]|uniref:hypothetical protein n=1 Tax=Streptacidiphilus sp. MAP12-33 TaxID=3156266 RepID=UPI003517C9A5